MTSQKQFLIAGLACPKKAWTDFFGPRLTVLPMKQVFQDANSTRIKDLAAVAEAKIAVEKPDFLILHDLGVTLGLLALLRLRKKQSTLPRNILLFNGAFRRFDVLKNTHPFKAQIIGFRHFREIIEASGGEVDPALQEDWKKIRHLYLQIAAHNILQRFFGGKQVDLPKLDAKFAIIKSDNDPFIDTTAIDAFIADFRITEVHRLNYGHFRYSVSEQDKQILFILLGSGANLGEQKLLKEDFGKSVKPFLNYLATAILCLVCFKDFVRVGSRPEWITI